MDPSNTVGRQAYGLEFIWKKVTVLGKLGYTIRGAVTKNDLSFPRVEREFSEGQRTRVFEKLETPKSRTLESVIYELCYDQQRKKNKGCFWRLPVVQIWMSWSWLLLRRVNEDWVGFWEGSQRRKSKCRGSVGLTCEPMYIHRYKVRKNS